MAQFIAKGTDSEKIRILDPCVGPFTFPQALKEAGVLGRSSHLTMVDIDKGMVKVSETWAEKNNVPYVSYCDDYLKLQFEQSFDCAILNPPYVRQEWIENKLEYLDLFHKRYSLKVPGTSNLYLFFLTKTIQELKPGGLLACVVYDSWQSTRFGRWLMQFLEAECDRISYESVHGQPFAGRLIDATVIYAQKKFINPTSIQSCDISITKLLRKETPLSGLEGFSPIHRLFSTQRGLRLKQVNFFMCDPETALRCKATPFLKKVSKVTGYSVSSNHPEAALIVTKNSRERFIVMELKRRLQNAKKCPSQNVPILTWWKERASTWMIHRDPPYADIVFNYYLRNRPKHVWNPRLAYSDNFYGLRAREPISPLAWLAVLNSTATCLEIFYRSRNQGNGLAKIQLYEYREASVPDLRNCSKKDLDEFKSLGQSLARTEGAADSVLQRIDDLVCAAFSNNLLNHKKLIRLLKDAEQQARRPKSSGCSCPG